MKIFRNLKFRKPDDYRYKSLIEITAEEYKQMLSEVEQGKNICLEINNNFYIFKNNYEGHEMQCKNCAIENMCLKINKNRICLVDYILGEDYYSHVFEKVDKFEIVFGDDTYAENL